MLCIVVLLLVSLSYVHSLALGQGPSPASSLSSNRATGLKIYNLFSGQKEEFVPLGAENEPIVWYMCGPIVHEPAQMGHARIYLSFDIARRILQDYFGYPVFSIVTVNDWDDRILTLCRKDSTRTYFGVAQSYEQDLQEQMTRLGVLPPNVSTRVTDCMKDIIDYIQSMVEQGQAYVCEGGGVNFDMMSYETHLDVQYCRFPPQVIREAAEAQEKKSLAKNRKRDFPLWLPSGIRDPEWPSPWGMGQPASNLDWSAVVGKVMIQEFAGKKQAELYTADLIQPYTYRAEDWSRYHVKSGGTQTTKLELQSFTGVQLRLYFLLQKYNSGLSTSRMDHAEKVQASLVKFLQQVKTARERLQRLVTTPKQSSGEATSTLLSLLQESKDKVDAALKDDFDTPTAMTTLVDLADAATKYLSTKEGADLLAVERVSSYVTDILEIFGVLPVKQEKKPYYERMSEEMTKE